MTKARDNATQGGLVLLTKVDIGSSVASVTVSNIFSSTYDNYKIMLVGGSASTTDNALTLQLGSSTTQYYGVQAGYYYSGGALGDLNNNASYWYAGTIGDGYLFFDATLNNPFAAKYTLVNYSTNRGSWAATGGGVHKVATSYTSFVIAALSGTITGGTIYVYGYRKN